MKNLLKLFENIDEMLEEGYEWTEEEAKKPPYRFLKAIIKKIKIKEV